MRSEKCTPTSEQQQDKGDEQLKLLPKQQQQLQKTLVEQSSDQDLSSCSLQIRGVWFIFAAPPRTTPAKKSDLALLDRNLLSTASPAINSW